MIFCIISVSSSAHADTLLSSSNFPDENFLKHVRSYDIDGNGYLDDSEISEFISINAYSMDIYTLKGIENFTNLASLNCSGNNITILDLSGNTSLKYINCYDNDIRVLDVSACKSLLELDCSYNDLDELELSENTNLKKLVCWDNGKLRELDLSKNTKLRHLDCHDNEIAQLELSDSTKLLWIDCSEQEPYFDIYVDDDSNLYVLNLNNYIDNFDYKKVLFLEAYKTTENYNAVRIEIIGDYKDGTIRFKELPDRLDYKYAINADKMTLEVQTTLQSAEFPDDDDDKKHSGEGLGSSGGGCDSGFAVMSVLVLLPLLKKNKTA